MSHLVYSTLGPGETHSLASPAPIPPYRADKENGLSAGKQTVTQVQVLTRLEFDKDPPGLTLNLIISFHLHF